MVVSKNKESHNILSIICSFISCLLMIVALSINELSTYHSFNTQKSSWKCSYHSRQDITKYAETVTTFQSQCDSTVYTNNSDQEAFCKQMKAGLSWYWMLFIACILSAFATTCMIIELNVSNCNCSNAFKASIIYLSKASKWILVIPLMLCGIASIVWTRISSEAKICWNNDGDKGKPGISLIFNWITIILLTCAIMLNCYSFQKERKRRLDSVLRIQAEQVENDNYELTTLQGETKYATFA